MNQLAYLDPATGSLIAATAAGGLAGVGVAAKSMWHRRTARFRKDTGEVEGDESSIDVTEGDDHDSEAAEPELGNAGPDAAGAAPEDAGPELEDAVATADRAPTDDR